MHCIAQHPHLAGQEDHESCLHASVCHLDPWLHNLRRPLGSRGSPIQSVSLGTCCHCSDVRSPKLLQKWHQ